MTKIHIKSKKFFITILILLLLSACLIVANYISIYLIKTESKGENVSNTAITLYMLSLSKSKVKKEAQTIAPDYQKIGAGGFVWQVGEYFHVLSSGYANKNDAELVKNSIKLNHNLDSEIVTIKLESFLVAGSFSADEKKVLSQAISISQTFFNNLYDIAISLDTEIYNQTTAKLKVNEAVNTIATTYANFNTLFASKMNKTLNEIKKYLTKMVDCANLLANDKRVDKEQTYSSHIKYRYIEGLNIYQEYLL